MPELPDVEIYKQYLDETALQRTIAAAELREPRLLGQSSARALQRALAQHRLTESRRLANGCSRTPTPGLGWCCISA